MATVNSIPGRPGRPVPPEHGRNWADYWKGVQDQLQAMDALFPDEPGGPAIKAHAIADARKTIEQEELLAQRQRGHLRLVWSHPTTRSRM